MDQVKRIEQRIKVLIWFFIVGLLISGITAFPIRYESVLLYRFFGENSFMDHIIPGFSNWIVKVYEGIQNTSHAYPFIFYGTDWLAFAHIVIAIAFIGPLRDPVKNIWIIEFGMIACVLVIPLALICGPIRDIPVYWRMIDCSFGIFGIMPLWITWKLIKRLENEKKVE